MAETCLTLSAFLLSFLTKHSLSWILPSNTFRHEQKQTVSISFWLQSSIYLKIIRTTLLPHLHYFLQYHLHLINRWEQFFSLIHIFISHSTNVLNPLIIRLVKDNLLYMNNSFCPFIARAVCILPFILSLSTLHVDFRTKNRSKGFSQQNQNGLPNFIFVNAYFESVGHSS